MVKLVLRLVLVLVVVFAGLFGYGMYKGWREVEKQTATPLRTPLLVGASPRMTSQFARDLENDIKKTMSSRSKPQAGVYGRNGQPEYLLVAGYGFEENGRQVLDGFIKGVKDDMTFGRPQAMPSGLSCTTANIEGRRGAVCAWAGDRSDGLLWAMGNRDVTGVAKMADRAREAVESPEPGK